jgi:hypothetical protein
MFIIQKIIFFQIYLLLRMHLKNPPPLFVYSVFFFRTIQASHKNCCQVAGLLFVLDVGLQIEGNRKALMILTGALCVMNP